jgi:hypothetical protein
LENSPAIDLVVGERHRLDGRRIVDETGDAAELGDGPFDNDGWHCRVGEIRGNGKRRAAGGRDGAGDLVQHFRAAAHQ